MIGVSNLVSEFLGIYLVHISFVNIALQNACDCLSSIVKQHMTSLSVILVTYNFARVGVLLP